MTKALWLLMAQGILGAFDTIYYHEWRARLPARGREVAAELKLHAARSFIYAFLYWTLPVIQWQGVWAGVLLGLFVAEIVITLIDFRVEVDVRKPMGGLYHGERTTHAIIGIAYGAMLAYLVPVLWEWWHAPTGLKVVQSDVPQIIRQILLFMGIGSFFSALRDLYAAYELPYSNWPWRKSHG